MLTSELTSVQDQVDSSRLQVLCLPARFSRLSVLGQGLSQPLPFISATGDPVVAREPHMSGHGLLHATLPQTQEAQTEEVTLEEWDSRPSRPLWFDECYFSCSVMVMEQTGLGF